MLVDSKIVFRIGLQTCSDELIKHAYTASFKTCTGLVSARAFRAFAPGCVRVLPSLRRQRIGLHMYVHLIARADGKTFVAMVR